MQPELEAGEFSQFQKINLQEKRSEDVLGLDGKTILEYILKRNRYQYEELS